MYRITFFDRNSIRPNIEKIVDAPTKTMAIEAARIMLHQDAVRQIEMITNGMAVCSTTLVNSKGEKVTCTMREVSPEYYNSLIDECWGIADVMKIAGVGKSVSSDSAICGAAAKLEKAQRECDNPQLGDSPIRRRKARWTKAQRAAREAAKTQAA